MAYTTIDDPSAHFHTQLYTGNGGTQTITNDANAGDFKPDWLWLKNRSGTYYHVLFDSSRGFGTSKGLYSNVTSAEGNDDTNGCTAVTTDGFTLGNDAGTNNNTNSLVAWQWKANGGTTTTMMLQQQV